jgi:hypothetical protein
MILSDYSGRRIRLTQERKTHVLEHPEMAGQLHRLEETLLAPELVVATLADAMVQVYHRYYAVTPVTSKYLLVVVKHIGQDALC